MKLVFLVLIYGISLSEENCPSPCGNGVSRNDEKIIADKHNEVRTLCMQGKIPGQPRGCNLKKIKYDRALGKKAQDIADRCKFEHVRVNDGRWYWVGQNLFMSARSDRPANINWRAAVEAWYQEYKQYHYPNDPGQSTGHYTQVVWTDTEYVGCGYKCFKDGGWYKQLYVCNYGPGGNIIGRAPYGTPDKHGSCGNRS